MSAHNSIVATYANHRVAKTAITRLKKIGFDMKKLFIAAKNRNNLVRESEDSSVISELGTLDEMLYGIGIPKESVLDYELEFKGDRLLLAAHGTASKIAQAKTVIDTTHPEGWNGNVGCAIYYGCLD